MHDADRAILDHFEKTRRKTLELLDRVPPEWLERTAPGEERPLGWLFAHLGQGVEHWMEKVLKDGKPRLEVDVKDPGSIRRLLEATQERLTSFFVAEEGAALGRTFSRTRKDGAQESFAGRTRVLYLAQHESHHRGKIVLALRQWGFKEVPFLPY